MKFLIQKNLPSPVKSMWKTLVVFILSALLFFPTPVLALDYSGTIQSYISNVKVELDSVLGDIKKLPNLSYENGKTALAEIDNRLQKIQTDARKNTVDFQKLRDKAQHNYEYFLTLQTLKHQARERRRSIMQLTIPQNLWSQIDLNWDGLFQRYESIQPEPVASYARELRKFEGDINFIKARIREISKTDYEYINRLENMESEARQRRSLIMQLTIPQNLWPQIDLNWDGLFQRYESIQPEPVASYARELRNFERDIKFIKAELEKSSFNLSNSIVLTDKMSKLSDALEKRVQLAKQKYGNVKDYADALQSFSDPDILGEISELDQLIADISKNLQFST